MGKIRVGDLAQMMGIANQDLIFKLRSIGIRVDEEHVHIDTDVLKEILQGGKKFAPPREVILRDEEAQQTAPVTPVRRRPSRRPVSPVRPGPSRRRTIIQRVEPRIKTIPTTERPKPTPEEVRPAARETPAAEAPKGQAIPAASASPQAQQTKGVAKTAGATGRTPAPRKEPAEPSGRGTPRTDEDKKARRGRKTRVAESSDALRQLRGSLEEIEAVAEEAERPEPTVSGRRKRRAERKQEQTVKGKPVLKRAAESSDTVTITEGMTLRDFAEKLGVKAKDLIKLLFDQGVVANINHMIEPEMALELAASLGVDVQEVSIEEEIQLQQRQDLPEVEGEELSARAPVVTVMGHVDHGKTTLLDAIRETRVTESEFGGITQHIGAYQVETDGRRVIFLDTPGHEAFTMMRARGAKSTDIVVLVVAADDGVMPQTLEAIDHAQAADVPIVVAINKIDKDGANPDRVKTELSERGLTPEDWGGDTVCVPLSAITREGIPTLLEMILLTADILELKASPELPAQGVVLEARKEPGRGIVATVLVQNGTLKVGDIFVAGAAAGRVRAMANDRGHRLDEALPATPVEVTGFNDLPQAGDLLQVVEEESKARSVAEFRRTEQRRRELAPTAAKVSLDDLFSQMEEGEVKELAVIVKADVQGSVEVLVDTLKKASTDRVRVSVLHTGVGAITTNDVLLASASEAIIFGFNVRPERNAVDLAEAESVEIRLHTVIYELVDELRKAMTGLLDPTFREVAAGRAEVREIFSVPKQGTVAGCHVVEGTIPRSAGIRLVRDGRVIHEGKMGSLRRFKDDVSEVRTGFDCGIRIERYQDVKPGDEIQAFVVEEVAPSL